jgi:hypothetical protein
MIDPSKDCGPECQPNCGPECGPEKPEHSEDEPAPDIPPLPENHLTQMAETLVLVMFVVGVYSQIFSLFLYAFGSSA